MIARRIIRLANGITFPEAPSSWTPEDAIEERAPRWHPTSAAGLGATDGVDQAEVLTAEWEQ